MCLALNIRTSKQNPVIVLHSSDYELKIVLGVGVILLLRALNYFWWWCHCSGVCYCACDCILSFLSVHGRQALGLLRAHQSLISVWDDWHWKVRQRGQKEWGTPGGLEEKEGKKKEKEEWAQSSIQMYSKIFSLGIALLISLLILLISAFGEKCWPTLKIPWEQTSADG